MSRRQFLEIVAAATAELTVAERLIGAVGAETSSRPTMPGPGQTAYPRTAPRIYRGKNLEAVAMPLGGIGTGSIWLDGRGRLSVWQIFNNLNENTIPDSFFGLKVRRDSGEPLVRALQTEAASDLQAVESLEFEGGYPLARIRYVDTALPVEVQLEAFNPLIPLDTANSSIPCAIFQFTVRNTQQAPVEVTLLAMLQNCVGSQRAGEIRGTRARSYGGNRNRLLRDAQQATIAMDRDVSQVQSGPVLVRAADGRQVAGPDLYWLKDATELSDDVAAVVMPVAAEGGVVLADGIRSAFLEAVRAFRQETPSLASVGEVFADFENSAYEGWTLTGEAFGQRPSRGTEPGQQRVTGFAGRGLVNTFIDGDAPQGTATSKSFRIQRRYVGFLIGGGNAADSTCINLRVDGQIVRTATGGNRELLEPMQWDVTEFRGRDAVLEIVDRASGPWGHINIDQIIFSDLPTGPYLKRRSPAETVARAIGLAHTGAEDVELPAEQPLVLTRENAQAADQGKAWTIRRYTRLSEFVDGEHEYRALVSTPSGDPLVIEGPLGSGRGVLVLAPDLPWHWGCALLASARGQALGAGEEFAPGHTDHGTLALTAVDPRATALVAWRTTEELGAFIKDNGPAAAGSETTSPAGETINAALGIPLTLQPDEARTATFLLCWHFPNVRRYQHEGNLYNRRWRDAVAVSRYVTENLAALSQRTRQYHDTVYQSNLPEEFLDAMTSQSVILRGPTCFWSEDGYFGGFEGCYGCCPLNCTHVWNYAQTHARLFPEVGRNMRVSNFITFLHTTGETSHREHSRHQAFIDGHCACIEAAYREHQLSSDRSFLESVWPGVKKAVDWLIEAIDVDRDGVPAGLQWNTYDTAVSGANTFIGSQYLAALSAAERLAMIMEDTDSARRWRTVLDAGMKNQNERLWNGEYYIQIPGSPPARDYNTGCHADQLLGQWWAHMVGLGYLYPAERIQAALQSVMKYNFRDHFAGFRQIPRRYVTDEEGGLLMCTWPQGGRPKEFIEYADEVWTGIEYATAGALIYEGLVEEARRIVRVARSRYDGRLRADLNSGPGGNPFNELECGKFYARAMSCWSLLIASQGQVLEGPRGLLGFRPNWQPEDHRSFFTAPEAWGLFVQQRQGTRQVERIEVRYGTLRLRELAFQLPQDRPATATVRSGDTRLEAALSQSGREIRVAFPQDVIVPEGSLIEVQLELG